jgi:hypothetical protein
MIQSGLLIQNTISVRPSIIHAVNCLHEWVDVDRFWWRGAFRVVDARPVKNQWPVSKPKNVN